MFGLDSQLVQLVFGILVGIIAWFLKRTATDLSDVSKMVREHETEIKLQRAALGYVNESVDDLEKRFRHHTERTDP